MWGVGWGVGEGCEKSFEDLLVLEFDRREAMTLDVQNPVTNSLTRRAQDPCSKQGRWNLSSRTSPPSPHPVPSKPTTGFLWTLKLKASLIA